MQALQQRCPAAGLALQAPVLAHEYHELHLFANVDLANVLYDALNYNGGNQRRARFVCLRVRARSFSGAPAVEAVKAIILPVGQRGSADFLLLLLE